MKKTGWRRQKAGGRSRQGGGGRSCRQYVKQSWRSSKDRGDKEQETVCEVDRVKEAGSRS